MGSIPTVGTMETDERLILENVNDQLQRLHDSLEKRLLKAKTPQSAAKVALELGGIAAVQKALETVG